MGYFLDRYIIGPALLLCIGGVCLLGLMIAAYAALAIVAVVVVGLILWFLGLVVKYRFSDTL